MARGSCNHAYRPTRPTFCANELRLAFRASSYWPTQGVHLILTLHVGDHILSPSQAIGAAGKRAEGEGTAETASSAYRDELVCTLLATVDHHPWGAHRQLLSALL